MYLTGFLLNPGGEIMGRQRQLQLTEREQLWGISQGDIVRVFETEIGDVGLVIGEDLETPAAQTMVSNGAEMLLNPRATRDSAVRSDVGELAGRLKVFVGTADLVGAGYRGQSGIYAPVRLGGNQAGIVVESQSSAAEILVADVDLEALRGLRGGMTH
jgi:predicted amidohydrolase